MTDNTSKAPLCFQRLCLAAFFFVVVSICNAQNNQLTTVRLNRSINYIRTDSNMYKALLLWDNFLTHNYDDNYISKIWSKDEQKEFGKYCAIRYKYLDYSPGKKKTNFYKPLILSISNLKNEYVIKTAFYNTDSTTFVPYITDIINVWVVSENGEFVLQSALYKNISRLSKAKLPSDLIFYNRPNSYVDNSTLVKLDSINNNIAKLFKTNTEKIYFFNTKSIHDYQQLVGYDYDNTMFITTPEGDFQQGALSEWQNKIIYNGTDNILTNATHELVHIYTYKVFGQNKDVLPYHNFISEGIATFLGGTTGKELHYLLSSLYRRVKKKDYNFNFSNLLDNTVSIGKEDANLVYIVGGLICKLTYEKRGMHGIFKLLLNGNTDEQLYKAIELELGVKKENLNQVILRELEKYVN